MGSDPARAAAEVRRVRWRTSALLAAGAMLLLPPAAAALGIAILGFLWLRLRASARERLVVLPALATITGALLLSALLARPAASRLDAERPVLEEAYAALWSELAAAAQKTAGSLGDPAAGGDAEAHLLATFERLQRLAETSNPDLSLFLLDPDGEAQAWAGDGLLHEPQQVELPRAGLAWRQGYTAVTLYAVAPIGTSPRPWRVVSGLSLATDRRPFEHPILAPETAWALGRGEAGEGWFEIATGEAPTLFLERPDEVALRQRRSLRWRRLAAAVLGLMLVALGSTWRRPPGVESAALRRVGGRSAALLMSAGVLAWAIAARVHPLLSVVLALAAGLAAGGLLLQRSPPQRLTLILGGLTPPLLFLGSWLLQRRLGTVDLADGFLGGSEDIVLRLAGCLAATGCLLLSAHHGSRAHEERAAWLALTLLLGAAAALEIPWLCLPLLALAGAAIVRWLDGLETSRRLPSLFVLLLLSALAAAVAWECAHRLRFAREVEENYLALIGPPSPLEVNRLHLELFEFFEGFDLAELRPVAIRQVDAQDLAFALWRESPLAKRDGLSALVVEPLDGESSQFAFGLSLDDDGELLWDPSLWGVPAAPAWQDAVALGEAWIENDGRPWARAGFWFVPRPGFRLAVDEIEELEAALLGGKPRREGIDGLPRSLLFGLYEESGRAVVSPWEEVPPLQVTDLEPSGTLASTPGGPSRYWMLRQADGYSVLFLPLLSPRQALERVGIHALASLLLVTGLLVVAILSALPWIAVRDLARRALRSYSQRLILVYTLLLLVPLVALNLFLLNGFEDRLRQEQLARGHAALNASRLFLIDFIRGIEPGFGIDTRVNRELLAWISGLVEHQVNFYWSNQVNASSQQELFTAGLLARRIPGDVYSRLALLGYELGSRTQHRGDFVYRELYAPLEVAGVSMARQGLFVSLPLLEQEEEVAKELATMRRRAVLVSSTLFLLLLAVGSRLAKSFTTPLMELIEGTRRIAAGERQLGLAPPQLELEALATAIDDMAGKIAEGREKLVREKQVVEQMVDNIASGIVSLDRRGRVLLHNRVAAARLGTEVGESLAELLERDEALEPVRAFLAQVDDRPQQTTVRVVADPAGSGSTAFRSGGDREWTLTWVPLPRIEDPAALLVVEDVTEVLRGQRLEAWAEMARLIAHEIKNPLTPIRLSTEHLQQVYRSAPERLDEVFDRCTDNILLQVDELREIASDFSIYSRIPRADPQPGDLVKSLKELSDTYRDAARGGVTVRFESPHPRIAARFDARLMNRAVRNLFENAVRASGDSGEVLLTLEEAGGEVEIRVRDSGPGVPSEILPRIFDPYFSTHETGTGLGLAITRRIVEEHGGRIEARNLPGAGLEVLIRMPRESSAQTSERPL